MISISKLAHWGHFDQSSSFPKGFLVQLPLDVSGVKDASVPEISSSNRLPIFAIAIDPKGTRMATGALDGSIKIWNIADGKLLCSMTRHTGAVMCLAWDPSGTILVSGSDDRVILLWSKQTMTNSISLSSILPAGAVPLLGSGASIGEEYWVVTQQLSGGHQSGKLGILFL